jgi:hypothetical protein
MIYFFLKRSTTLFPIHCLQNSIGQLENNLEQWSATGDPWTTGGPQEDLSGLQKNMNVRYLQNLFVIISQKNKTLDMILCENNKLNMTEKKYLIDLFNDIYVKSYFKLKVVHRI